VEDYLTDTLLYKLVVGWPHQAVIPYAGQVLQDREKVRLSGSVQYRFLQMHKTCIGIIKLDAGIVKSKMK
jgi:hypothetical protein